MSSQACIEDIIAKKYQKVDLRLEERMIDSENGNEKVDLYVIVKPADCKEYELHFRYNIEKMMLGNITFEKEDYDKIGKLGSQIFGDSFTDQNREQRYSKMLSFLSLETPSLQEEGNEKSLTCPSAKDILHVYEGVTRIVHTLKEKGVGVSFEADQEKTDKLETAYNFFK